MPDELATDTPVTSPPPPPVAESGDPLSGMIQPQSAPQYEPQPGPGYQPLTTPANQDPEMVAGAHHQSWLGHVMSTVGSILGGDTTLHVTKKPDGSVEVTHDPSSEGEKWGRVAAAALGGAAHGIAVGQGPGGPARAAAAGIQTGLQQPQQRLDAANQEASVEQQRMQAHANLVLTQQRTAQQIFANKMGNIAATKEQLDDANKDEERFDSSPNSERMGHYGSVDEIAKSPNVQHIMEHHPNGVMRISATYDKDFNPTGFNTFVVDKAWADQLTDKPVSYLETVPAATAGGKPSFKQVDIPAGRHTNAYVDTLKQAKTTEALKANEDWAKYHKEQQPKTLAEMNVAIANAKDPQEKADLMAARDETFKEQKELKVAGRNITNTAPGVAPAGAMIDDLIKPGAAFAPGTVNGTDAQKLASGDVVLNDLPKRMGKGVPTPQEMIGAAEAYSQKQYGLGYSATQIDQEKKFYENMKTQGATQGIDKMIGVQGKPGYLDTVLTLAKQAGITDTAAPLNKVVLHIKTVMGQAAAANFQTALGEVQRSLPSLIGNPLLGGSDSDMKLKAAQEMLGKNPTLGSLTGQAETIRQMLRGSMDSITRNNRFFQRQYGLKGDYAHQVSPTHSATAPNQPAATQQPTTFTPAAKQPPNPPGQGYTYGDGPQGTGWYPPPAAAGGGK